MAAVLPFLELRPEERTQSSDVLNGFNLDDVNLEAYSEDTLTDLAGLADAGMPTIGRKKKPKKFVDPNEIPAAHEKKATKDADGRPLDVLQKPHTELTRLLWARKLMIQALSTRTFTVEQDKGDVYVRVSPPVPEDIIPWHKSGQPLERFSLFSTNSKMTCPTFDLPAGHMSLGGACPGAAAAQSTVDPMKGRAAIRDFKTLSYPWSDEKSTPPAKRSPTVDSRFPILGQGGLLQSATLVDERKIDVPNLPSAVCTYCYATGGKYGEVVVQFSEVGRLAFVQRMLSSPAHRKAFHEIMRYTIVNTLSFLDADDPSRRFGVKPIRVHSSGDFFNFEYADFWMELARDVQRYDPSIRFWAPTRTHVIQTWAQYWATTNIPTNFSIRPSAYHVGDPAPQRLHQDQPAGPGNAKGTSVLYPLQSLATGPRRQMNQGVVGLEPERRYFDHQCQVYALEKGNKTCSQALSPSPENGGDGAPGCRACWTRPDLAVNYVVH